MKRKLLLALNTILAAAFVVGMTLISPQPKARPAGHHALASWEMGLAIACAIVGLVLFVWALVWSYIISRRKRPLVVMEMPTEVIAHAA